ncbi:hypothetical protein ACFWHQ_38130 [Streptomyces sp. NPDC060334]|uniref:hypothetical protein n=1 Tax=unclassified Streptomyces TaxID=2593676 RepID=UPI003332B04B
MSAGLVMVGGCSGLWGHCLSERFSAEFRAVLEELVWQETKRPALLDENGHPHSPTALASSKAAKDVHLEYARSPARPARKCGA